MCLILFAYRTHPRYRLVLAANRDEFHARPTAPMAFWDDAPAVLAGRDLAAGGTWFGVDRQGRFAAVTNYRDPQQVKPDAPSRGALVSDYLTGAESAWDYLQRLAPHGGEYNGFNLLVGDAAGLFYYSNRGTAPMALKPGVYGLSNHLLNTPWPKVEHGRHGLAALLTTEVEPTLDDLLTLLTDRTPAADQDLPNTGVSFDWEKLLSPLFIESPTYGSRSSTIFFMESDGTCRIAEKTWADGTLREFRLPPAN